jgi:hypothetical protein
MNMTGGEVEPTERWGAAPWLDFRSLSAVDVQPGAWSRATTAQSLRPGTHTAAAVASILLSARSVPPLLKGSRKESRDVSIPRNGGGNLHEP